MAHPGLGYDDQIKWHIKTYGYDPLNAKSEIESRENKQPCFYIGVPMLQDYTTKIWAVGAPKMGYTACLPLRTRQFNQPGVQFRVLGWFNLDSIKEARHAERISKKNLLNLRIIGNEISTETYDIPLVNIPSCAEFLVKEISKEVFIQKSHMFFGSQPEIQAIYDAVSTQPFTMSLFDRLQVKENAWKNFISEAA